MFCVFFVCHIYGLQLRIRTCYIHRLLTQHTHTHTNKQYKMDNTNFLISVERVTHKNNSRMPLRYFWETRFMFPRLHEL